MKTLAPYSMTWLTVNHKPQTSPSMYIYPATYLSSYLCIQLPFYPATFLSRYLCIQLPMNADLYPKLALRAGCRGRSRWHMRQVEIAGQVGQPHLMSHLASSPPHPLSYCRLRMGASTVFWHAALACHQALQPKPLSATQTLQPKPLPATQTLPCLLQASSRVPGKSSF